MGGGVQAKMTEKSSNGLFYLTVLQRGGGGPMVLIFKDSYDFPRFQGEPVQHFPGRGQTFSRGWVQVLIPILTYFQGWCGHPIPPVDPRMIVNITLSYNNNDGEADNGDSSSSNNNDEQLPFMTTADEFMLHSLNPQILMLHL